MRLRLLRLILFSFLALNTGKAAWAQTLFVSNNIIPLLAIEGAIGPAVRDYLVNEISRANSSGQSPLIVITLDTPGGLSSSLRDINQSILHSAIPIACLVYPQGARAASAGTYILYACHFSAMASATTLGAATPVNIAAPSGSQPNEKAQKSAPTAMEKKVLNDAIAYIRSLAQLRGRNQQWAELAVSEAATLTAIEAVEKNVIDLIAENPEQLLQRLDGKQTMINGLQVTLALSGSKLVAKLPDWRNQFIKTITDPNIAYILMLIGIYGLLLEFYSPGVGVAGITGAISLFIAFYAFQLLPVSFVGVGLLALGISLMVVESFAPSFGVLGIGGLIAFVLGSIFLIDTEQSQFQVSLPLIAAVAFMSAMFLVFVLGFLWRARNNKIVSGLEEILGARVLVTDDFNGMGHVLFNGERWAARSEQALLRGQFVRVSALKGLTLQVKPEITKEKRDGSTVNP